MKINKKNIYYDAETDSLYIFLKKGKEEYFEEIKPNIIIEFNKNNQPLGIEILNASSIFEKIIKKKQPFFLNDKNKIYQTSKK